MFFYNLYGVFLILFPSIKIQYHEYRRREEVWHWTFHSIFKFKIWKWKDAEVAYFRILISKNAIQQYIFRAWNYCWQRQYLILYLPFNKFNKFTIFTNMLRFTLLIFGWAQVSKHGAGIDKILYSNVVIYPVNPADQCIKKWNISIFISFWKLSSVRLFLICLETV